MERSRDSQLAGLVDHSIELQVLRRRHNLVQGRLQAKAYANPEGSPARAILSGKASRFFVLPLSLEGSEGGIVKC